MAGEYLLRKIPQECRMRFTLSFGEVTLEVSLLLNVEVQVGK